MAAKLKEGLDRHYSLSNDVFRVFLDGPTLTYTCCYFMRQDESLEEAARLTLELVAGKLDLGPGERVRGLRGRVEVVQADGASLPVDRPWDKVAVIGMSEHVVDKPPFFRHLREYTRPGGLMLLHSIMTPRPRPRPLRQAGAHPARGGRGRAPLSSAPDLLRGHRR